MMNTCGIELAKISQAAPPLPVKDAVADLPANLRPAAKTRARPGGPGAFFWGGSKYMKDKRACNIRCVLYCAYAMCVLAT